MRIRKAKNNGRQRDRGKIILWQIVVGRQKGKREKSWRKYNNKLGN